MSSVISNESSFRMPCRQNARKCTTGTAAASSSALSQCATTLAAPTSGQSPKAPGVGWLPTYVPALGDPLIPLDLGVKFELDIWLAYHPDAKKIPRVRQLIEW